MPFASNGGVRIHYRTEGSGPPLLLHHWSLGSSQGWYEYGYVDRLRSDFTVIAHDVRGHGRSDKPRDPEAYAQRHRLRDILVVLDELGIERADYYGYSMGGWMGYGVAQQARGRFHAIAVGGAHPFAQDLAGLRELLGIGVERGASAFAEAMAGVAPDFARVHRAEWMTADFAAQRMAAQDRTSLESVLPTIDCPWLALAGTEDDVFSEAQRACREIRRARFEPLADLDHGGALERSDLVAPLLRSFFDEAKGSTG